MQLNLAQRELVVKVVYYGPGLSGKTTNLQCIHERTRGKSRGRLLTIETSDDRTLFFDLFPVYFRSQSGFQVKVKLFTVPGQVIHNATRRVVLQQVDAVAFIADGRRGATDDNNAYWRNLHENLLENALDPSNIPVAIQYNKCDLPDALTEVEIEQTRRKGKEPVFSAVAIRGEGVLETLHAVLELAYRRIDAESALHKSISMSEAEFLDQVFSQIDLSGTKLEGRYPLPIAAEQAP